MVYLSKKLHNYVLFVTTSASSLPPEQSIRTGTLLTTELIISSFPAVRPQAHSCPVSSLLMLSEVTLLNHPAPLSVPRPTRVRCLHC